MQEVVRAARFKWESFRHYSNNKYSEKTWQKVDKKPFKKNKPSKNIIKSQAVSSAEVSCFLFPFLCKLFPSSSFLYFYNNIVDWIKILKIDD